MRRKETEITAKMTRVDDSEGLRKQAEEKAARIPANLAALLPEEVQRMLHELRVHQIELEMQNEELRRARGELETSRTRYLDLYDLAPVGYFTISEKGLILEANLTAATLLVMDRGSLIKQPLTRFIPMEDQDTFYLYRKQLLDTGTPQTCELRMAKKDGMAFWAELIMTSVQDADGIPVCHVTMNDITERKRAEEKIKSSLLEKETMLKEIHHRVKNNLTVISSLLDLQSSYLQDEKAKEMLRNSMERVSTMAKIHTMLYQSADMSRIDFGGFIRDLVSRLQQSYGIAESPVDFHVDVDDISLTIETSIPCGLILNELVTNALKHAFPEGRGGAINIIMKAEGDQFILTVRDNGIGFPGSVDFHNPRSLGLELVSLLVRQVNGTIDLEVEGGTKFTIAFPKANNEG
jgi:PAS domain S-box-containing protein